jgi:hypothetical protein
MVMELSWVVPWYRSLTPVTYAVSIWRVFFVLGGIILLSNLSTRAMNYLDLKISIRRGVIIALIILSVFLGLKLLLYEAEPLQIGELFRRPFQAFSDVRGLIPDEFLVTVVVLVIFWRGLSLASKYIDPVSVRRNFYLGLAMFVVFIFINTIITGETPGAMLYLFFVSALIAMGSARIFIITQLRGGARNPFDLRWFLGIFITSLVIVSLAGLAAWLFGERTSFISGISSLILGIFGILMLVVISPIIFIAHRLSQSMPGVSGTFDNIIAALEDLRNTFSGIANSLLEVFGIPSLANWVQLLKPFLLWGLVIILSVAIIYSISRWLFNERTSYKDVLESVIEPGELARMFRKSVQERLDSLVQSFRGRSGLLKGRRWLAAAKIRRIYTQLMDLSAKLGEPRPPAHTPLEFLPVLERLFPEGKNEVTVITQAYLKVRYGELPESVQEVNVVESAWKQVEMLGKEKYNQMSKEQKKSEQK